MPPLVPRARQGASERGGGRTVGLPRPAAPVHRTRDRTEHAVSTAPEAHPAASAGTLLSAPAASRISRRRTAGQRDTNRHKYFCHFCHAVRPSRTLSTSGPCSRSVTGPAAGIRRRTAGHGDTTRLNRLCRVVSRCPAVPRPPGNRAPVTCRSGVPGAVDGCPRGHQGGHAPGHRPDIRPRTAPIAKAGPAHSRQAIRRTRTTVKEAPPS